MLDTVDGTKPVESPGKTGPLQDKIGLFIEQIIVAYKVTYIVNDRSQLANMSEQAGKTTHIRSWPSRQTAGISAAKTSSLATRLGSPTMFQSP